MTKIGKPIPGRVYSAAKDGIVTGADSILDDYKNKHQQQINAEVDSSIELLQGEINALDSQNYYTVEATQADTTIDSVMSRAGVVPQINTLYRVGKWDGTQYDATVYSEYAYNVIEESGEWKLLDVKSYGIDDEPTAGSDNLVKSGGVAEYVSDEDAKIKKVYSLDKSDTLFITDKDGNVLAKFDKEGLSDINIRSEKDEEFYITDKYGNVIFKANKDGIDYIGKGSDGGTSKKDDGYTPSDIVLNLMYGQSLSLGGFIDSGQNISTLLQFNTADDYLMAGCTEEVMASQQLLNQYFGNSLIPSKTNIRCTGVGFANLKYMQMLQDENDIDIRYKEGETPNYFFQLLGVCPSVTVGGASWAECADVESLCYRRLLKAVEYGKKLAEAANKTFSVGSLCYMQGENSGDSYHSETQRKDFHDKLWVLFSNLNHDIKAITGQENDVIFLTYQLASQVSLQYAQGALDIPLAQLDIALETGGGTGYTLSSVAAKKLQQGVELIDRKNILLGAIMNSLDPSNASDHVHATNNSYSSAGAQFGIQMKRAIYDGKPVSPIYPKSHKVINRGSDYLLVLDMDVPVRPLVFDTNHSECESQRATLSNYGFSILNGANEIITNVYLRRGQEVLIACSSDPTGLELTYAKDGWEHGGNLRDSQDISFNINGFNYKAHNWCPTFAITI